MKTITEIAQTYQERGTWDRFQNESRLSQNFTIKSGEKNKPGPLWYTTNSEYGRFQGRDKPCVGSDQPGYGGVGHGEDGGMTGEQLGSSHGRVSKPGSQHSRKSTAGVKLPPIEESNLGSKPGSAACKPEAEARAPPLRVLSPSLGIPPPAPRKRLTTGVAKRFMANECSRFWENMQTVADGAGLDLRTRGGSRASRADVLTIDGDKEVGVLEERDDDAYSHSIPSLDGSLPPTPAEGRKQ